MKNNFFKSAATHGVIIGLALVILSLADWSLGFYGQKMAFGSLSYIVMIGGLVWAAISYRNKERGGYITYGQALSYSVVVAVCYAFISGLFSLLLTQVIDPNYIAKVMEFTEQKMLDMGLNDAQVEMAMQSTKKFMHPAITFVSGLFTIVLISTIIALITSAIVKRSNPNSTPFNE